MYECANLADSQIKYESTHRVLGPRAKPPYRGDVRLDAPARLNPHPPPSCSSSWHAAAPPESQSQRTHARPRTRARARTRREPPELNAAVTELSPHAAQRGREGHGTARTTGHTQSCREANTERDADASSRAQAQARHQLSTSESRPVRGRARARDRTTPRAPPHR